MDLLRNQEGVVGRQQLLAAGWNPSDIRRALRRRELAPIMRGTYVDHTGEPTWLQRAWAAVLTTTSEADLSDVALSHESALRIAEGPGRRDSDEVSLHVTVRHARDLHPPAGVVLHRTEHFDARVARSRTPPRLLYEEAVIDVAASGSAIDALALLARVVGDRRTTAARLLNRLEARGRVRQRDWMTRVLDDVDQGTHSVLEHGFLSRVIRPHRLPDPSRQKRELTAIGVAYRDASYGDVLIELDGRLFHTSFESRNADLDRDLEVAVSGRRTVRLGWAQVFERPCRTARALAQIGIATAQPCGPDCAIGRSRVMR